MTDQRSTSPPPQVPGRRQLVILGATGATGTTLTKQALAAGHQVTAVVRDPARLAVPRTSDCRPSPPTSWTQPRSAQP